MKDSKFAKMENMETFLVQAENEEQAKLVQAFIKQHKLKSGVLSDAPFTMKFV